MTVILDPQEYRPGPVRVARPPASPATALERVLFAGPNAFTGPLSQALDPLRYAATAQFESLAYLTEGVQACAPSAVVVALGAQASSRDLECSAAVAASYPTVVWTQTDEVSLLERALAAGASAYIAGDAPPERINTVLTVARVRFAQQRSLRADLAKARQALADRKVIDRAKGILMDRRGLGEDQAYHLMRRIAMNHGRKLAEIAQRIVANPAQVQAL